MVSCGCDAIVVMPYHPAVTRPLIIIRHHTCRVPFQPAKMNFFLIVGGKRLKEWAE
jgi:hypothetical protein